MIKDKNYLLNISERILNKAKKLGATDASVVVTNSISEDINYRNKKIDGSTRSENLGANLTTYFGKKKSSLTTSNLREDVLDGLVEKCF
jgi:PmbA protein